MIPEVLRGRLGRPNSFMIIRQIQPNDRQFLLTWGYDLKISHFAYIIENPLGIPVFHGCLFSHKYGPGFIEGFIASPFIEKAERRHLVKAMLDYLIRQAKAHGCKGVISTTAIPTVKQALIEAGYTEVESGLTSFYRSF